MSHKIAHRRYMKLFIPSMIGYLIGIALVVSFRQNENISQYILMALSLIPAACMFTWMWGHWRFINEIDEYMRTRHMRAIMFGLAIILSLATFWGLLEELVGVPAFPVFFIVPLFYLAQGLFYGFSSFVLGDDCAKEESQ